MNDGNFYIFGLLVIVGCLVAAFAVVKFAPLLR